MVAAEEGSIKNALGHRNAAIEGLYFDVRSRIQ